MRRKRDRRIGENGSTSVIAHPERLADAHNEKAILPVEVADGLQYLVGEEAARVILHDNSQRVLAGKFAGPPRVEASVPCGGLQRFAARS